MFGVLSLSCVKCLMKCVFEGYRLAGVVYDLGATKLSVSHLIYIGSLLRNIEF